MEGPAIFPYILIIGRISATNGAFRHRAAGRKNDNIRRHVTSDIVGIGLVFEKVDPQTAEAIDQFVAKLKSCTAGDVPFTFILDESSRNSFIENPISINSYERELELDIETVVKVLQPGSLGIIEHKFFAQEIHEAKATVK